MGNSSQWNHKYYQFISIFCCWNMPYQISMILWEYQNINKLKADKQQQSNVSCTMAKAIYKALLLTLTSMSLQLQCLGKFRASQYVNLRVNFFSILRKLDSIITVGHLNPWVINQLPMALWIKKFGERNSNLLAVINSTISDKISIIWYKTITLLRKKGGTYIWGPCTLL